MGNPYSVYAAVILLTIITGLWRVFRGPTKADRMLLAQLCGTTIVAVILLFAQTQKEFHLLDIALVFALLTAVATVAFVKLVWRNSARDDERGVADD